MAEGNARQRWAHTSNVMALIANVNRDPKKGRAFRPADFNPYLIGRRGGIRITVGNIGLLKRLVKGGRQ